MDRAEYREALYESLASVGRALASPRRLELIELLVQAPRHVDALAQLTGMPVASVSQHLQGLRRARLVVSSRAGKRVVYRIADPAVGSLWAALRLVAARRLPELAQLAPAAAGGSDVVVELTRTSLDELVHERSAVLLDVRPAEEFSHAHIEGAISMPLDELEERAPTLPRHRPIAVYCRGSLCPMAEEAVTWLTAHGFEALRFDGGWLEWVVGGHDAQTS